MVLGSQGGTVIDLNNGIVEDLVISWDLPLPICFDDLSDFVHSFDYKHMGISKIVFRIISVLI